MPKVLCIYAMVVWCFQFGICVSKSLNDDCGSLLGWILMRYVCSSVRVKFVVVKGYICGGLPRVFGVAGFGVAKHTIPVFFPLWKADFGKITKCCFWKLI